MSEVRIEGDLAQLQKALETLPAAVRFGIMRKTAELAERETLRRYQSTTRTWDRHVQFESKKDWSADRYSVSIGTDDPIYGYVDKGTRPHAITPKGPGYPLRFRSGYNAKTTPGVIGSGPGGPFGDWVRAMSVWHPGTKPRGFSKAIYDQVRQRIWDNMRKLVHAAMKEHVRILRW